MDKKSENVKSYILGTIGALIGGLIATLPWVLTYVYANMILSALAIIIAIGAFKGYEIFKGKMDKKVPFIIGIVSIICVTVATFVMIPNLLIINEYGKTNMEAFKLLLEFEKFRSALIGDYVISLLFTVLGMSGVISSIKRGIDAGDEKITFNKPIYAPKEEDIKKVKEIFEKKQAFSKTNSISNEEVINEVGELKDVLNFLTARGIVKKTKDDWFYDEEVEHNPNKRVLKICLITFAIMVAVIILIAVLV